MANLNQRNITNSFQDCRLVSLATWTGAAEINPRDRGGPYLVLQEGYDPDDLRMIAEEFVLGRSGKWLSLGMFYQMSVEERRAEFVFGTAAEVMRTMGNLPSKTQILRPGEGQSVGTAPSADDEMAAALRAGRQPSSGTE